MSVSLNRRTKKNRVPHVNELREAITGPTAVFDWGAPLKPMTMTQIAAQPAAEWEYSDRDATRVAEEIAENLAAIGAERDRIGTHTVAMALMPVAAQLDEPLPGTNWAADLSAVLPPRVMPTSQETAMPDRLWLDEPTPELLAAAAQRDATIASWASAEMTDGDPRPIGMDPFHEPGNPECSCTPCTIAAVTAKPEPAADEPWPFLYSPAQLDGTACARCGWEFAINELNYPVVTAECNEMFRHRDDAQCGPAVAPWNDADDAGTEAAV